MRDAGWAESLSVDNLILVTKLGEEIYGNKKDRSCMTEKGALSGGNGRVTIPKRRMEPGLGDQEESEEAEVEDEGVCVQEKGYLVNR